MRFASGDRSAEKGVIAGEKTPRRPVEVFIVAPFVEGPDLTAGLAERLLTGYFYKKTA
jgi:hypothetical protein